MASIQKDKKLVDRLAYDQVMRKVTEEEEINAQIKQQE